MPDEISAIHVAIALLSGRCASQDNKFNFIIINLLMQYTRAEISFDYNYAIIPVNRAKPVVLGLLCSLKT